MVKPSQNGLLLLKLNPYLKKGVKRVSGKYKPVSLLGAFF
jgi:hypothetical protein